MDVPLEGPFIEPTSASARYSSTRGFSGGLITGLTFVFLARPKNRFVVTVVAIGLYWFDSFRAPRELSMEIRDVDDSRGAEPWIPKDSFGGMIGLVMDEIDLCGG